MVAALPAIALGTSLLGVGVSTLAASRDAQFKSKIAIINAKIAEDNAERAVFRSQVEAQDQDRMAAAVIGEEISKQAGSCLNLRSGSFVGKRQSLRQLARLDVLRIRQEGDIEAFGFLTDARVSRATSSAFKRKAQFAVISGVLKGVGAGADSSLISGALTRGSAT